MIRSLWAMVQGDPVFMRRINGWLAMAWVGMIPIAIFSGLLYSVAFISVVSIYANIAGHWAAWQASRVEVRQEEIAEENDG